MEKKKYDNDNDKKEKNRQGKNINKIEFRA